jgi:intermediate peptidase
MLRSNFSSLAKLNFRRRDFKSKLSYHFLVHHSLKKSARCKASFSTSYYPLPSERFYSVSTKNVSFIEVFDHVKDLAVYPPRLLDQKQNEGLFTLPVFSAADWDTLVDNHIQQCKNTIDSLANFKDLQPSEIVRRLDRISELLCLVSDATEACRHTHSRGDYVDYANRAHMKLGHFLATLNTHQGLYEACRVALQNQHLLTEEQIAVAIQLKDEFEHNGVHLSESKRRELYKLQGKLEQLTTKFLQIGQVYDTEHHGHFEVYSKYVEDWLPRSIWESLQRRGDKVLLTAVPSVVDAVLRFVPYSEVRKDMFLFAHQPNERLQIFDNIIHTRYELAKLLGFSSFAQMASCHRTLKTTSEIVTFLNDLAEKIKPLAELELQTMRKIKREFSKTYNNSRVSTSTEDTIWKWDTLFCTTLFRRLHIRNSQDESPIREYFTLGRTLEGINLIAQRLYGLTFHIVPASEQELPAPSVRKMAVKDERGEIIGIIYLDLFPRNGKFTGAANFPLKFWTRQSPIARGVLVANIPRLPKNSRPPLLNISNVTELFHEFGHTFQLLLARNELQQLAGTRRFVSVCFCLMKLETMPKLPLISRKHSWHSFLDFVEMNSTFMENFASDYRILRLFAQHYRTGSPLPEELLTSSLQWTHAFAATDSLHQLWLAVLDQFLHSDISIQWLYPSTSLANELHEQYTLIKTPPNASFHQEVPHLISYGAGYYTYLYSSVFSSQLWQKCFKKDPLNREVGQRYVETVLQYGGAKDPKKMMLDMLGEGLDIDGFVAQLKNHVSQLHNQKAL